MVRFDGSPAIIGNVDGDLPPTTLALWQTEFNALRGGIEGGVDRCVRPRFVREYALAAPLTVSLPSARNARDDVPQLRHRVCNDALIAAADINVFLDSA